MEDFRNLDDYQVLGVTPNATPDEIKRAYRREIAQYHPDRFRNADAETQRYASARSQRITEAYAALRRGTPEPSAPRSARAAPVTPDQLEVWYDRALRLIASGDGVEAARLLRQVQKVDPFYRDVDQQLAIAESLAAAGRAARRPPLLWVGISALALALALGGMYGAGLLRSQAAAPAAAPEVVVADPTSTPARAEAADDSDAAMTDAPSPEAGPTAGGAVAVVDPAPTPSPTATPLPTETPPPTATLPPTETPIPPTEAPPTPIAPTSVPPTVPSAPRVTALERGEVIAAVDFNRGASGWAVLQQPAYTIGPRDGAYAITTQPGAGAVFAYGAALGQSDVVISADVTPVRGWAGLIFGPDRAYRFFISPDGRFRVHQGAQTIVGPTASNAVWAGTNRLSIAAAGQRVSLYANGTLLANLDLPSSLRGTTPGFVVLDGPQGGEGIFDNLTIRTLPR